MRQRTKLANILSAYRALAPFVRESYQTRPPSLTAYNMFVKNNLRTTEVFLDKREALAKACVVAEFNISEGSLPPIETTASGDRLVTSLQLSEGFSIDETTTLGEVSSRLVGCNASLCYGDRISILYLMQVRPDEEFGSCMPHAQLTLHEFVLEGDSRIPFYTLVDERLFRAVEGRVCTDGQVGEGAVGYVHSRKTKRCTEYSTQSLVLLPDTVLCRAYGSFRKSDKAAASYESRRRGDPCGRPQNNNPTTGAPTTTANGMPANRATARVAPPTTISQQGKACPTTGVNGTTGRGIAQTPVKTKRAKTLQEKRKKKIRGKL
jgi:hypothetical protein